MANISTIPKQKYRLKKLEKMLIAQGRKQSWLAEQLNIDKSLFWNILKSRRRPKNLNQILDKAEQIILN